MPYSWMVITFRINDKQHNVILSVQFYCQAGYNYAERSVFIGMMSMGNVRDVIITKCRQASAILFYLYNLDVSF